MFIVYKIVFCDRIKNNTPPYFYIGSKSNCNFINSKIYDNKGNEYYGSCKSKLFKHCFDLEKNIKVDLLHICEDFHSMLELERSEHIENSVVISELFFNAAIATSNNNFTNPQYTNCIQLSTGKIAKLDKDNISDGWVPVSKGRVWCNNGTINKTLLPEDIPYGWNKGRCNYKHKLENNFTKNKTKEDNIEKSVKTRKERGNYIAHNKGKFGKYNHSSETKLKMSSDRKGKNTSDVIYTWFHPDHGIKEMTQYDLYTKYQLTQSEVNMVAKGKKKSHKKWCLYDK